MPTPSDLKKALIQAGFEVYRTRGDVVHLADRVRENLLMDSGIFINAATCTVTFVVRAQKADFPADDEAGLFSRARGLGEFAVSRGYAETQAQVREVLDPGGSGRTLDVWCEVAFERIVSNLEQVIDEVRVILPLNKAAS